MKNAYIAAAVLVCIARAVIGLAFMLPIVAVCALLDRLSYVLCIKGGIERVFVDSNREDIRDGLAAIYYDLSRFE